MLVVFVVENEELYQSNTLEGQLRKNKKLLENLQEKIKEVQHQIAIVKGIACVC